MGRWRCTCKTAGLLEMTPCCWKAGGERCFHTICEVLPTATQRCLDSELWCWRYTDLPWGSSGHCKNSLQDDTRLWESEYVKMKDQTSRKVWLLSSLYCIYRTNTHTYVFIRKCQALSHCNSAKRPAQKPAHSWPQSSCKPLFYINMVEHCPYRISYPVENRWIVHICAHVSCKRTS